MTQIWGISESSSWPKWKVLARTSRDETQEGKIVKCLVSQARVYGLFPESNRELPKGCFNFNFLSTKQNHFSILLM